MRLRQDDHFKTAKFKECCMADSIMSPCILYNSHITHAHRLWNHSEGLFALDLIVLAAVTYLVMLSEGNQLVVGYTSLIIVLETLIGILAYHIFHQVTPQPLTWQIVNQMFSNVG